MNNDILEIKADIREIKTTLKHQAEQLEVHIKRTNLLEDKLVPLNSLKDRILGGLMLLGALGGASLGIKLLLTVLNAL